MTRKFLDEVYALGDGADTTRQLYQDWAATYDAEVAENGYATPARCAAALVEVGADKSAALLDIGCGTGLAGLAYAAAGFELLDGTDISSAMLERAAERGIYRELRAGTLEEPVPFEAGAHPLASAVGLFSPEHAPPELIDTVMNALPAGGRFVFSLNDHALQDRRYEGRIMAWTDSGAAHCLFREHGPHLPARELEATVYVLGKN